MYRARYTTFENGSNAIEVETFSTHRQDCDTR